MLPSCWTCSQCHIQHSLAFSLPLVIINQTTAIIASGYPIIIKKLQMLQKCCFCQDIHEIILKRIHHGKCHCCFQCCENIVIVVVVANCNQKRDSNQARMWCILKSEVVGAWEDGRTGE